MSYHLLTNTLPVIFTYILKVFCRVICSYIIHELIYRTYYTSLRGKNRFLLWLLKVFFDLWGDQKRNPEFPQEKPLTLICQQKETRILNLAVASIYISVLDINAHGCITCTFRRTISENLYDKK